MARIAGTGAVQKFILAEIERHNRAWLARARRAAGEEIWPSEVASLAYAWANRDLPPEHRRNRREFTPAEYESVRRAAVSLFRLGRLGKETIWWQDGEISWGYILPGQTEPNPGEYDEPELTGGDD